MDRVGTVHNGADTFKPYDPSKIAGDTTPNTPAPNNGSDCGGLGQLLVIAVAVVVAYFTAGAALAAIGTTASAAGAGTPAAAGAVGGAVGSIAGQVVGNAIGVQAGFSWKQVALGAIGGAVAGDLSNWTAVSRSATANVVVRAAVSNAVTQGVAVATGLQDRFDRRGVAAAAGRSGRTGH